MRAGWTRKHRGDIERVLPLDNADEGLKTMANRRARGKIVISVDD
jgi:hypothetical protein